MTGVTSLPIHTPLDPAQVINVCMHACVCMCLCQQGRRKRYDRDGVGSTTFCARMYVYIYISVFMYSYVCVHVCVHICMYQNPNNKH